MNKKSQQFIVQADAVFFGLGRCLWHADYDVPQHCRIARRSFFEHREGEDVRRPVDAAVAGIETSHPFHAHEQDAQFSRAEP